MVDKYAASAKFNKPKRPGAADWARLAAAARPLTRAINPFVLPEFPKAAVPPSGTMAMDNAIGGINAWSSGIIETSFQEGVQFLGYPYLSMLSQRPEYRVIVEVIAGEMTRKWGKFEAVGDVDKTDQIKQLNDEFERLEVKAVFRKVAELDGYFGRGHLFIDLGGTETNKDELKTPIGDGKNSYSKAKVSPRNKIKRLTTVEPVWAYPTTYDSVNPLKPDWYNPQQWFVMGSEIHASRLLRFVAHEVPDLLKPAYSFGGISLTQMAKPYVDYWIKTRDAVGDLVQSFVVWQLATNLAESLMMDGNELFARVDAFTRFKQNRSIILTDKEAETFQNTTAPLSGLEMLQAQAQEHMAAIVRIPLVKLLGIQPAGLNASSEGEIRVFYDTILEAQTKFFEPNLKRVINFVMLGLWGAIDPDITWTWEPLWALDEKQEAEVEEIKARTGQIYTETGIVSQEEERKRVADAPNTPYPGLDPDDTPDLKEEQEEGLPQPKGAGGGAGGGRSDGGTSPSEGESREGFGDTVLNQDVLDTISFSRDEFKEADHPRGNTENAGQFTSGSGGAKASKPAKGGKSEGGKTKGASGSKAYKPSVVAEGLEAATEKKIEWRATAPDTLEKHYATAQKNQDALVSLAKELASKFEGVVFSDPGIKSPGRAKDKLKRGKSANSVNDIVRGGFTVDSPETGDKLVKELAKKFEIADEGWQKVVGGYFDRKVMVRFEDGQVGEIQMWPPGMVEVKNGPGHALYEKLQSLGEQSVDKAQLIAQMSALYAGVLGNLSHVWGSTLHG